MTRVPVLATLDSIPGGSKVIDLRSSANSYSPDLDSTIPHCSR